MRKSVILIVAVASVGFHAAAKAATIEPIKGRVTPVELGRACSNAGGSFNSNASGYSCEKTNCNGKGGTCGVYCASNGKCTGTTADIKTTRGSNRAGHTKNTVEGALMGGSAGKTPSANTKNTGKLTRPQSKKLVQPQNKKLTQPHNKEELAAKPPSDVKQRTSGSRKRQ